MSEVCEWLDREDPNVVIATDGSLRDDVTGWGGVVWRDRNKCFEWSSAKWGRSNSFRAESKALEDAMVVIGGHTSADDKVVVLTDSLKFSQQNGKPR